jgi:hypothetical protein
MVRQRELLVARAELVGRERSARLRAVRLGLVELLRAGLVDRRLMMPLLPASLVRPVVRGLGRRVGRPRWVDLVRPVELARRVLRLVVLGLRGLRLVALDGVGLRRLRVVLGRMLWGAGVGLGLGLMSRVRVLR